MHHADLQGRGNKLPYFCRRESSVERFRNGFGTGSGPISADAHAVLRDRRKLRRGLRGAALCWSENEILVAGVALWQPV